MREQLIAIVWAQFRITRNHFPRTTFGTFLSWCVNGLWYLLFVALALLTARSIQHAPDQYLVLSLSSGLLAMFAYMQIVPLVTTSSGWSLQLDKLQAFPISTNTFFAIEVVLRLTSAPEMLILLGGAFAGLLLRSDVSALAPWILLLFIPFCLFLQLAIRDFILHSFARNRFREILTILLLMLALLPQLLVREGSISQLKPYALAAANGSFTPWHQIAVQSLGHFSLAGITAILGWNIIAALLARRQFMKSLRREDSFQAAPIFKQARYKWDVIASLTRRLPDPLGALVEKELRTLLRMPRFRVPFGMACLFGILVFLPVAMEAGEQSFFGQNAVPITGLYGLLILSDVLLLNIFGFDRGAAQLYFTTPVPLSVVVRAKNLTAVLLVAVQALAVPILSFVFRMRVTGVNVIAALLSSAVVTVFLMSAGNAISVYLPRPVDPRSPLRKQGGTKVQLWLLVCALGMFVLVGFAFLARWASDRDWVLLAVLSFEFLVGSLIYKMATESTLIHALANREYIVMELSKSPAPLGSD